MSSKRTVKVPKIITEEEEEESDIDENMPIPEYVFDAAALDEKYPDASMLGGFKIYFGKFKGKTYDDAIKDIQYCRFVMRFENVKSNGIYLLRKYITLKIAPTDLLSPKKKRVFKAKPKSI